MSFFSHAALSALLLAGLQAASAQEQAQLVPAAVQIQSKVSVRPKPAAAPVMDHYQQALVRVRSGRISEAHELLRQRLREEPKDLAATRLLASLLLDGGQLVEAAQVLSTAQALSPQNTDIAIALARLQAEQKAYPLALQTLERSAEYARQDADYVFFMAVLAAQAGQSARAIPLYQQALQLAPGQGAWWLALGAAQQAVQDRVGARSSYEIALASGLDAARQRQAKLALRQLREPVL